MSLELEEGDVIDHEVLAVLAEETPCFDPEDVQRLRELVEQTFGALGGEVRSPGIEPSAVVA